MNTPFLNKLPKSFSGSLWIPLDLFLLALLIFWRSPITNVPRRPLLWTKIRMRADWESPSIGSNLIRENLPPHLPEIESLVKSN